MGRTVPFAGFCGKGGKRKEQRKRRGAEFAEERGGKIEKPASEGGLYKRKRKRTPLTNQLGGDERGVRFLKASRSDE
jgi:hypothetical protein